MRDTGEINFAKSPNDDAVEEQRQQGDLLTL